MQLLFDLFAVLDFVLFCLFENRDVLFQNCDTAFKLDMLFGEGV
jgi:hypothetical protein